MTGFLRNWLGKSVWALMDQCLFAFSNFLLNVCLARWLAPDSYGAFSLAFSVFLFVGVVHTSIFTEPMLVFGSGRYEKSQKVYLQSLVRLHWTKGWPVAAILICIGSLFYWNNSALSSILFLSIACGSMLYQWLIRRACYLQQQPSLAAIGGFLYLALVITGLFLLRATGNLDAIHALAVMAISSLASGYLIQWKLLRSGLLTEETGPGERELIEAHWDYGRWSIATGVIGWLSGNIAMVTLPWWHGNAPTATFRAGLNLILPVQQLLAAAGPLLLPFLVRRRTDPNYATTALRCSLGFMLPPLLWTLFLFGAGPTVGRLLYSGQYTFEPSLLLALGLTATIASFNLVVSTALRAMERPKLAFHGYAASAVVSLVVGLPLIVLTGIDGAAWSLVLAVLVTAGVLTFGLIRQARSAGSTKWS